MLFTHTYQFSKRMQMADITRQIKEDLRESNIQEGIIVVYTPHTTAGITINENADPDVRHDLSQIMDHLIKENERYYEHTMEGADDMPAHAKCSLFGASLTIPITNGCLNLGTWQGIYLCEFRNYGGSRRIVATIYE